jgi:hypothetical protein
MNPFSPLLGTCTHSQPLDVFDKISAYTISPRSMDTVDGWTRSKLHSTIIGVVASEYCLFTFLPFTFVQLPVNDHRNHDLPIAKGTAYEVTSNTSTILLKYTRVYARCKIFAPVSLQGRDLLNTSHIPMRLTNK